MEAQRTEDDMSEAEYQARLEIDYPNEGETVAAAGYTFRVGAEPRLAFAEVSIDRGPWLPCRQACGFWWYDWSGYGAGEHTIAARAVAQDGRTLNSTPRRFAVARR
jgi:hypothetical protein